MGRYQEIELSGKTNECTAGPGVHSLAMGGRSKHLVMRCYQEKCATARYQAIGNEGSIGNWLEASLSVTYRENCAIGAIRKTVLSELSGTIGAIGLAIGLAIGARVMRAFGVP